MKISEEFPSKYLRAPDLKGRTVRVTIASVHRSEDLGDGKTKPIAYFQNAQKGLVLNKTNASTLAYAFGDDTDNWIGAAIELFPMMVSFQGQMQPAIRIRVPADAPPQGFAQTPPAQPDRIIPNAANRQPAAFDERNPPPLGAAPAPAAGGAPFDDEIPF